LRNIAIADRSEWTINAAPPPKPPDRPRRVRDWLATLPIVLLIPALIVPFMVTFASGPRLQVSGRDVHPGDRVRVTASGLVARSVGVLVWDDTEPALLEVTADRRGRVRERLTIPETAEVGRHTLALVDPDGVEIAATVVRVTGPTTAAEATPEPTPDPTPDPTPAPTPTAAPAATSTPSPTPRPTTAPTATPRPSAAATSSPTAAPTAVPTKAPVTLPTAAPTPTPQPTAAPTPTPGTQSQLSTLADALYPAAALRALPMSGAAWNAMKSRADASLGTPNISDQDDPTDVNVLAAAFVYGRTGTATYRTRVAAAIKAAVQTENGGRTLALGRNLPGYVISAAVIDLPALDPTFDRNVFRPWLRGLLTENLDGRTLRNTHEDRPNNWGTHAGAARAAIALYLGDTSELAATATVFRGWLGDRSAYAGFSFGDLSWQCEASKPVAIVPAGCVKSGVNIDGALPEEMRRGGALTWPPTFTDYAWEGLQGAMLQADLLYRAGYPTWAWSDRALLRAARFLYDRVGWSAAGDDQWQPWLIDRRYGTSFRGAAPARTGKNFGWTDWLYGS
jgi:Alginate lyase